LADPFDVFNPLGAYATSKMVASAPEVYRFSVSKPDVRSNEPFGAFFLPCHLFSCSEDPISQTVNRNRGSEGLIPASSLPSLQSDLAILGFFTRLEWNRRSYDLAAMDVPASLETGFPACILFCGFAQNSSRETTPPL